MTIEAGKLDKKVELWGKIPFTNALGKEANKEGVIKHLWCEIIPQTNNMQRRPADTILTNCTHKFVCRYQSAKMVKNNMYFMFRERRFDVLYSSEPYFEDDRIEIFVQEVIE